MPPRSTQFAQGEYYHVFNRGNNKREIFANEDDYARFLVALLLFQAPPNPAAPITNVRRLVHHLVQHQVLNKAEDDVALILRGRYVQLVAFALMPNHFHCLLQALTPTGVSVYLQRVLDSYGKYWNTKREQSGHLFEGPFKAVHIEDDAQLTYCSAYIHRNPRDLEGWYDHEHEYPWSSYRDYVQENRWGEFLKPDIIVTQVGNGERYRQFVEASGVKERIMDPVLHID